MSCEEELRLRRYTSIEVMPLDALAAFATVATTVVQLRWPDTGSVEGFKSA